MRRLFIIAFIILLVLGLSGCGLTGEASKGKGKGSGGGSSGSSGSKGVIKSEQSITYVVDGEEVDVRLRTETREKDGETYQKIKVRGVGATSDLKLNPGVGKVQAQLSNGNKEDIKVLPDKASENAVEKIKTNKNIDIRLRETGTGGDMRVVYDFNGNTTVKLLGLFKVDTNLSARVDSETGEVLEFLTPWWYFLVGKEVLAPVCDAENLELCEAEGECSTVGGYWYDDICNAVPELVCDIDNLNLCGSEFECTAVGGYWYAETCNPVPEPQPPVNETEPVNGTVNGTA